MGERPHPPQAPDNSAFVRCFCCLSFLFLTNLRQEQLCLPQEKKERQKEDHRP